MKICFILYFFNMFNFVYLEHGRSKMPLTLCRFKVHFYLRRDFISLFCVRLCFLIFKFVRVFVIVPCLFFNSIHWYQYKNTCLFLCFCIGILVQLLQWLFPWSGVTLHNSFSNVRYKIQFRGVHCIMKLKR